jgi:hypothetical protein
MGAPCSFTVGECALDVMQDVLDGREVLFVWIMNVEAHLLKIIGDAKAREGEVLQCPQQDSNTRLDRPQGHWR